MEDPDVDTEGVSEPLPRALEKLLRRAVLDHALSERRRLHVPRLHVGTPGQAQTVWAVSPEDRTDHALRTDVVASIVGCTTGSTTGGVDPPLVWLTRPGELEVQDVDAQWLAAARAAYGEAGLELVLVLVNRHGWRDPRSGVGRRWQRLRRR